MRLNSVISKQTNIHPTAIVSPHAFIGEGVQIGPYCVVSDHAKLGDHVCLKAHVVLEERVTIGSGTTVYPFAVLGGAPQHKAYKDEPTEVIIGSNSLIREHVTIHRGSILDQGKTIVGNDCMVMVGVHLAHDCHVGNGVIIANNTQIAGHVKIGDYANIGGMSAIHQFVRIGKRAMIGGNAGITADIIPYGIVMGDQNCLSSLNFIGLKRMGVSREEIEAVRDAFFTLFEADDQPFATRLQSLTEKSTNPQTVQDILDFIQEDSKRSLSHKKGL